MTSEVSIGNMALSRVGSSAMITSFSATGTQEQRGCNLWYAACRNELLESFPWAFAARVVTLAEVADAAPGGWTYAYRYPANCAQVLVVTDENGMRSPVAQPLFTAAMMNPAMLPDPAPWQVHADDAGRLILTDVQDAVAWIVTYETDPTKFNAHFASALAWRIAGELVGFLRADPRFYSLTQQGLTGALSMARANVLNEQQPDPARASPSILARGG